MRLKVPETAWDDLLLILTFDDRTTVYLPLHDFFAIGRAAIGRAAIGRAAIGRGGDLPTRSLLVGLDGEDRLYSYFPMPFFRGMSARLTSTARAGPPRQVGYWIRRSTRRPDEASGLFGAQVQIAGDPSPTAASTTPTPRC